MQIIVDGQLSTLKKGSSFEYVSENRLFSGSDGYTFSITFPLRDCEGNRRIFGRINRLDVAAQRAVFDCEIRDRDFVKYGCIVIVEISQSEVKAQFLDGRSEQNYRKTLDDYYINELDLGEPEITDKTQIAPSEAWGGALTSREDVALPWYGESGNIQNAMVYDEATDSFSWHEDLKGLTWQPYLIVITRRICDAIGYTCDLSAWESDPKLRWLIICNVLPYAWGIPQYARALPHWTVEEYFTKLELLLGGEFEIDHNEQTVKFSKTADVQAAIEPVKLEDVVDDFSTDVSVDEASCDYINAVNIAYKDCDHPMAKFYSCHWFIKNCLQYGCEEYDTLSELLAATRQYKVWDGDSHRGSMIDKLYFARDVNKYFVIRAVTRRNKKDANGNNMMHAGGQLYVYEYDCILQPVNVLGPRIVDDSEDADTTELEFVPACINYTDEENGMCLYLNYSGYDETDETTPNASYQTVEEAIEARNNYVAQTQTVKALEAGEGNETPEYYNCIYVAWWEGLRNFHVNTPPHPYVEDIEIYPDWSDYFLPQFSLRLNKPGAFIDGLHTVDPAKKTSFRFLSDKLPDVRAVFHIRGRRYVCEKLTATFTEHGMSRLINGEFYPITD